MSKTEDMRKLVDHLRQYRDDYASDEYLPTEINRLILIIQGRIYELEEAQ